MIMIKNTTKIFLLIILITNYTQNNEKDNNQKFIEYKKEILKKILQDNVEAASKLLNKSINEKTELKLLNESIEDVDYKKILNFIRNDKDLQELNARIYLGVMLLENLENIK